MDIVLMGWLTGILCCQASAVNPDRDAREMQYFLDREWGFECRRSDGRPVVRAVCARGVEQVRAREFLASLSALDSLDIEFSTFGPGDIRSLARRCPSIIAICVTQRDGVDAAQWPEFFAFPRLRRLSVERLHWTGNEKWPASGGTELESLAVSGNLSGMVSALLAPCRVRSLRMEFRPSKQELTAADYQALGSHTEIESLEILGDPFAGGMLLDLGALASLKRLRQLTLRQCSIDSADLHRFARLRILTLHRCRFIKHGFDTLLAHPALEELTLWDYRNDELGIVGPYPAPSRSLRTLTLRFPVCRELKALHGLPCVYRVQLGNTGMCGPGRTNTIRHVGPDEIAAIERLQQLRSVSVLSDLGTVTMSADALRRLSQMNTLRSLELIDVEVVPGRSPSHPPSGSSLEEVRVRTVTALSEGIVGNLLGKNTQILFVGEWGDGREGATDCWNTALRVPPIQVGLSGAVLPIPFRRNERLLTSSVKQVVLDSCWLKKGAIRQLTSRLPSLRRLSMDDCIIEDQEELLHLNGIPEVESVDFTNEAISATTARAIKAQSVRFGGWPHPSESWVRP